MKTKVFAALLFAGGIVVGAGSSEIIHAQAPALATRQVFQTDLNNLPGQEVLLYASTWQPGFRLPLHMHPEGHELIYVVEGELLETSGRLDADGGLREQRLTTGTALAFGRGHVHWVVNPAPKLATSLHVYSPPLTTMDFYETEPDSTFRRLRTELADPRPEEKVG